MGVWVAWWLELGGLKILYGGLVTDQLQQGGRGLSLEQGKI